jgi:hypothetical protein
VREDRLGDQIGRIIMKMEIESNQKNDVDWKTSERRWLKISTILRRSIDFDRHEQKSHRKIDR